MNLESIARLRAEAVRQFGAGRGAKTSELDEVFTMFCDAVGSLGRLYAPEELEGTQREAAVSVLVQAVETVLAMYFLSESGFWDNALALKRNYSELLAVAIAIGYDQRCYVDWKNERSNLSSFAKISKRVQASPSVPDVWKSLLTLLATYWTESSQRFSHHVGRRSIRTVVQGGQVYFEPKVATHQFQEARMNALRNMLLNVVSILMGVTDFGRVAYEKREELPEAANVMVRANACLGNEAWKSELTS